MSSKSGTGSKQQTSLFSFFGGGGGNSNAGSKKSESGTSASSSSKKRGKTKADASKKGSNAKGGGKKIDTAGGSSAMSKKETRKTIAGASRPSLATSTKKRRIASGKDEPPASTGAATSTTTPRKPSEVIENVPDFSTFSYAKNESATASADDTPMSAATTRTAASTPSLSPLPSSASTPSDAANADADVRIKAVEKEDATKGSDGIELPSTQKDLNETVMEDAQALNDNDTTSNADADEENDGDNDDDGESETKNGKSNSDDDDDDDSSSDSDTESTAAQGEYQLSEYELLRLRNIERNNRRLAELGLAGGWSSAMPSNSNEQRQKAKKKSRKKVKGDTTKTRTPVMPTRRSTRARRSVFEAAAEGEGTFGASNLLADNNVPKYQEMTEIEEEPPVEEVFTVSPMLEYAMNADDAANTDASAAPEELPTNAQPSDIQCLEPIGKRLAPPNGLGAIYSLQFYPREWCPEQRSEHQSWIVGAGKAGIISLWNCHWSSGSSASTVEEDDMIDPVLSWKAHSGRWVADVRFLPSTSGSEGGITKSPPSRLLSAANDGSVCLWDLSTVSSLNGSPKLLCRTGKELHRSGIFAMDVDIGQKQTYVATGSKDKTVAVTTLDAIARGSGVVEPFWVSDYHTAKVGAVAFCGKGTSLLASASDDGTIAVHDFRADGKKQVVAELVDAHYRPHSVSWDPLSANHLMTAGLDDQVKVFDIRSLDMPLYTYQGHVPTLSKYKRIHHPVFYNPCQRAASSELFVLSGGESSAALSMFRNQDAKDTVVSVYSRGRLPEFCGDAGCLAVQSHRVASTVDGGEVLLLGPKLSKG